jgi:hypothetical protein
MIVKNYKVITCQQEKKIKIYNLLNQKLILKQNLPIELFQVIIQKKMILLNHNILDLKNTKRNWKNRFICVQILNLTF